MKDQLETENVYFRHENKMITVFLRSLTEHWNGKLIAVIVSGYIKPFFKDITVYDERKDKEQGIFHQMREVVIGGVAKLLENRSRQEVATNAED